MPTPQAPDGTTDEIPELALLEIPEGASEKEQADLALAWVLRTIEQYGHVSGRLAALIEWVKDEGY